MENDLITQAIRDLHFAKEKSLKKVQNYLSLRYKIDLDQKALELRVNKISQEEKAVA